MSEIKDKIKSDNIEKPPMPDSMKFLWIIFGIINIIVFLIVIG